LREVKLEWLIIYSKKVNTAFVIMAEMRKQDIFTTKPPHYNYDGLEHSNQFLQLLLRGVAMNLISTSKAAALSNLKHAEFRKFLN